MTAIRRAVGRGVLAATTIALATVAGVAGAEPAMAASVHAPVISSVRVVTDNGTTAIVDLRGKRFVPLKTRTKVYVECTDGSKDYSTPVPKSKYSIVSTKRIRVKFSYTADCTPNGFIVEVASDSSAAHRAWARAHGGKFKPLWYHGWYGTAYSSWAK